MRRAALLALALLAGCGPAQPAPRAGRDDPLPSGATLVYFNAGADEIGSVPTRIILVGGCYLTETWKHGSWELLNRAFVGAEPAAECGTYR